MTTATASAATFPLAVRVTEIAAPRGGWVDGSTDARLVPDSYAAVRDADGAWWPAGGEFSQRVALPLCGHVDPSSTWAAIWRADAACAVCTVEREGLALPAATLEADRDGLVVNCHGSNHRHTFPLGTCTGCGREVARNDRGNLVNIHRRDMGGRQAVCWSGHRCADYDRAQWALVRREHAAQGVIHKGATVRVVKGRKVAKGTVGVVRWLGEDSWNADAMRLGLAVEGQTKLVYVTSANVEIVTS
jgi:hypothetical protein